MASMLVPTPLQPDTSCCNRANWCTELPPLEGSGGTLDPAIPARLEALLLESGWSARCRHPRLKVLRHPSGHEVAWVVATGRVQIRVDLAVPDSLRQAHARLTYRDLCAGLQGLAERLSPE